ncbi:MAG: hypothetical protein ACP5JG_12895 [Anaerolineae bacterium]
MNARKRDITNSTASLLLCLVLLAGCRWPAPTPDIEPGEVVNRFYRWYLGYPGNPLVERAYRTSPYLAPAFIDEIDETLSSMQAGGGDPILLAQDVPNDFSVEAVEVSGDEATALLHLHWGEGSPPVARQVDLAIIDGEWRITDVRMVEP